MKRIIIGAVLLVSGLFTALSIVSYAMDYLPHITTWLNSYPSKLFFLIFAGQSMFNDGTDGLGLGLFFSAGIFLAIMGLVILLREYFSKESKTGA
ncbi:MAG: hypothetical protein LBU94_05935 [Clostridiales bacterium]|jgi:hypothetical protein|nr:hypothetical protein [Clostridiales bacterium]